MDDLSLLRRLVPPGSCVTLLRHEFLNADTQRMAGGKIMVGGHMQSVSADGWAPYDDPRIGSTGLVVSSRSTELLINAGSGRLDYLAFGCADAFEHGVSHFTLRFSSINDSRRLLYAFSPPVQSS